MRELLTQDRSENLRCPACKNEVSWYESREKMSTFVSAASASALNAGDTWNRGGFRNAERVYVGTIPPPLPGPPVLQLPLLDAYRANPTFEAAVLTLTYMAADTLHASTMEAAVYDSVPADADLERVLVQIAALLQPLLRVEALSHDPLLQGDEEIADLNDLLVHASRDRRLFTRFFRALMVGNTSPVVRIEDRDAASRLLPYQKRDQLGAYVAADVLRSGNAPGKDRALSNLTRRTLAANHAPDAVYLFFSLLNIGGGKAVEISKLDAEVVAKLRAPHVRPLTATRSDFSVADPRFITC